MVSYVKEAVDEIQKSKKDEAINSEMFKLNYKRFDRRWFRNDAC